MDKEIPGKIGNPGSRGIQGNKEVLGKIGGTEKQVTPIGLKVQGRAPKSREVPERKAERKINYCYSILHRPIFTQVFIRCVC